MFRYIVKRVLLALPTLLGITFITFIIVSSAPGNAAVQQTQGILDPRASEAARKRMEAYWELDKPWYVRYPKWLGKMAQGDMGYAMSPDGRPVRDKITERLLPTMSLAIIAMVSSLLIAIPIGLYSAVKQNGFFDSVTSTLLYALYSIPSYVMAVPLILIVSVQQEWLPFRGMTSDDFEQMNAGEKLADLVKHYLLITFCFSYGSWAFYSRFVRQNMLEVLRQDYIRTARAKGQKEHVIVLKHAFRNTFIPMLTLMGLLLPEIISGSVILEVMFNWPGIGRLLFESMLQRDINTIMGLTTMTACLVLLGMLLADIGYAFADPRVAYD